MRSDLVFGAIANVSNRYLLSQLASKAARKFHRSGARMQDRANDVLVRFSRANPVGGERVLPQRPAVQLRPKMTPPSVLHKSKVVALASPRENSNPLWEAARVLSARFSQPPTNSLPQNPFGYTENLPDAVHM
jgi:hypothetical protein